MLVLVFVFVFVLCKIDPPYILPMTTVKLPCCKRNEGKFAIYIDDVFTEEECEELIVASEAIGYKRALVIAGDRHEYDPLTRNNMRCVIDDHVMANKIFDRIKEYVPETFDGRKLVGINTRLRFLRYEEGQYFKAHYDGSYNAPNGDKTLITLQLYLREGTGGATRFLVNGRGEYCDVEPIRGRVLMFEHNILHGGAEVEEGVKYVIRTDILYRKI